jgi:hypothetical protein
MRITTKRIIRTQNTVCIMEIIIPAVASP